MRGSSWGREGSRPACEVYDDDLLLDASRLASRGALVASSGWHCLANASNRCGSRNAQNDREKEEGEREVWMSRSR